jgi:hypothetical protein
VVEEYKEIIKAAFREFINQRILTRLDIQIQPTPKPVSETPPAYASPRDEAQSIQTTDREIAVFSWIQRRLCFMVQDQDMFELISELKYRDYQGKFVIYFRQERKGRICEYYDRDVTNDNRPYRFAFPQDITGLPRDVEVKNLNELDSFLLLAFQTRVKFLGGSN